MPALDQTFANSVLDAMFDRSGASVRLSTGPMKCRLMTANGTATSNGTELTTGGGYTSGTGAPSFTTSAASAGVEASNSAITVTNMPAPAGGQIVGVEVWDSAGSPLRKMYGALASAKTVNAGDTFSIASGSLTLSLG